MLQGDLKPVKERFFGVHLVKFHFVLLFHLQISNRLNQNKKKKKRIIIHLQHILRVHFFFINKGALKKKCRVLNEFMQVTVF